MALISDRLADLQRQAFPQVLGVAPHALFRSSRSSSPSESRTNERVQGTLAAFCAKAAAAMVSMGWITWVAAEYPEKRGVAILAALDRETADRTSPFVRGVFLLDREIARREPAFRHWSAQGST